MCCALFAVHYVLCIMCCALCVVCAVCCVLCAVCCVHFVEVFTSLKCEVDSKNIVLSAVFCLAAALAALGGAGAALL